MGHRGLGLAILHCKEIGKEDLLVAVYLSDLSLIMEHFERVQSEKIELLHPRDFNPSQYTLRTIYVRQRHPAFGRKPKDLGRCAIQLPRTEEQSMTPRRIFLHSNWTMLDGMVITTGPISDGIFGRLMLMCRDGFWFQILLKKFEGLLLATVVTDSKSDQHRFRVQLFLESSKMRQIEL
jgi:hypothetical protein